ncbi:hypothetical protein K439DRAFT_1618328 [Ramaria rubella]|nr:hypothetical protein K439DRAFT_1618328 [Ramaria rubella]
MHHYKPLSPVLDHLPMEEQRIERKRKKLCSHCAQPPYAKRSDVKSKACTLQTHAIGGGDNDNRHSSSTSDVESDSSNDSDEAKIAKPTREPGRPGRGGYNLEVVVNWEGL